MIFLCSSRKRELREKKEAGKCLYIDGPLKRTELDQILQNLLPAGLALRVGIVEE